MSESIPNSLWPFTVLISSHAWRLQTRLRPAVLDSVCNQQDEWSLSPALYTRQTELIRFYRQLSETQTI